MSNYLIKTVGIDLAPACSGLATVTFRAGSWEAAVVDAAAVHIFKTTSHSETMFKQHLIAADKIIQYVKKHKPDLIGIENLEKMFAARELFKKGHLSAIVRTMLFQEGYRQLLVEPYCIPPIVTKPYSGANKIKKKQTSDEWKQYCVDWVNKNLAAEFDGNKKQVSDMADAAIYALIAACFFAYYWLHEEPPLNRRQREVFFNKVPRPDSKVVTEQGWVAHGLMDTPGQYLIRNPNKEADTYTPEWMQTQFPPMSVEALLGPDDILDNQIICVCGYDAEGYCPKHGLITD